MKLNWQPVTSWINEKLDYKRRKPSDNFEQASFPCVVRNGESVEAVIATHRKFDNGLIESSPRVRNGEIDLSLASFDSYARYNAKDFEKE